MPRSFVMTLFLCLFVPVSSITAEDSSEVEQLKAEIKALKEEVQALKERVTRSIEDQKKIAAERDRLKTELQELKKKSSESEEGTGDKSELIPLESKWNGKLITTSINGETTWEAKVVVIKRELDQFTIDLKSDRNFQWEFDCELKDSAFKIVNVRRIRGLDGLDPNKLVPVAGITGKGRIIKGKELRMDYLWPKSQLQPDDKRGRLRVTLESE